MKSPVSSSLTTAAVRPAAEDALPDVYTARGKNEQTYLKTTGQNSQSDQGVFKCEIITYLRNWDFEVEGSPTIQMLMSPRRCMPSGVCLCTPPMSCSRIPFLTISWPYTVGAMDSTSRE